MRRIVTGLAIALCLACQHENEKPQTPAMNTDIDELSKLIRLPAKPSAAKWIRYSPQIRGAMGPNDFVVVALLEFSPEEMQQVRSASDAPPDSEPMALRDSELPIFFTAGEAAKWDRPSKGFVVVPGKTFGPAAFTSGRPSTMPWT